MHQPQSPRRLLQEAGHAPMQSAVQQAQHPKQDPPWRLQLSGAHLSRAPSSNSSTQETSRCCQKIMMDISKCLLKLSTDISRTCQSALKAHARRLKKKPDVHLIGHVHGP